MFSQRGQALITLLFFMLVAIMVTSAALVIMVVNMSSASLYQQGILAYYAAESGVENALLQILRDTAYSGETLATGNTTTVIEVSGTSPIIITSQAQSGNTIRKIEAQAEYTNDKLSVTSWKEVF